MKFFYATLFFLFCHVLLIGQTTTVQSDTSKHLTHIEIAATFPGGTVSLMDFVKKNMQYPPAAKAEKRGGITYITFVIEIDGSITDAKVLKTAQGGSDLDEEALRIVKSMPKWIPGTQDGKAVRVQFNLPIRFSPNL